MNGNSKGQVPLGVDGRKERDTWVVEARHEQGRSSMFASAACGRVYDLRSE